MLMPTEVIDRQGIKNPTPLSNSGVAAQAVATNPAVSENFYPKTKKDYC